MSSQGKIEHSTTFGRETVTPHERDRRMREIFRRLAPHYDRLCDVMTLGLHRGWRQVLADMVTVEAGQRLLDVAGGCGETAACFAGPDRQVIVLDSSLPMMETGRAQATANIDWVAAVGRALPFPAESMDVVTISFGLRNVTFVGATLREALRVLKRGGRFFCLEVSRPAGVLRPLHHAFARHLAPWLGTRVTRAPDVYDYFVESVIGFPGPEEVRDLLDHVGFADVRYRTLSLGIACIHSGTKP
jgi:demethylmenaquinone methyltransferase / 2-methoxy-6-polyprenyl-1,4-benzoquinol methylase